MLFLELSKEVKVERRLFKIERGWCGKRFVVIVYAWIWWSCFIDLHCFITFKILMNYL